jgi:Na+/melibiose symporter-like transporter
MRFIKYANYVDFSKAVKTDSKIDILSEMNNYFRSLLTCVLLLPVMDIAKLLSSYWSWFATSWKWIVIGILFILFLLSYRKQSKYVRNRVAAVNSQAEINEKTNEIGC